MTNNETPDQPDNVIDIRVNVNATDRLIEAIEADVDILPADATHDDITIIRLLVTLRDRPDLVRGLVEPETQALLDDRHEPLEP